jgi:hypothetical protein
MVIRENFFREIEFKEKNVFKPREKSRSLILGSNKIRLGIEKHLLNINIRDQYDSIKECFLSPIYVYEDEKKEIKSLEEFKKYFLIKSLFIRNSNEIGQIIQLFSQQFNQIHQKKLNHFILSKKAFF